MTVIQSQSVLVQPNQFLLSGHDIAITYEATSIAGVPQLFYKDRNRTLNFRADQLRSEQTQLGQMVTVTVNSDPQAIGTVETLTLLIPTITVLTTDKTAPIQTTAIFSLRSPLVKTPGQSQTYLTVPLAGTANQVDF